MVTIGMRSKGRAALCTLGLTILSASAINGCTSSAEVSELKKQVASLQGKLVAVEQGQHRRDAKPPSQEDQLKLVKERELALQSRVDKERASENKQTTQVGRERLERALRIADERARSRGASGSLAQFTCYATLCRAETSHPSDKAYDLFVDAAFGSGEAGEPLYPAWVTIPRVQGTSTGTRTALLYLGVPKNLPPLAPPPKDVKPR